MAIPRGVYETTTYSGRRVIIYTFDAGGQRPIHGAYSCTADDSEWIPVAWFANGRIDEEKRSNLDIVPPTQG
jgi:hypothetical protein